MSDRTDVELVAACLEGDNRAYEELVRKYQKPIYNLALRMVRKPEDAEDITQTVFVKAYEKLEMYDSSHQFFSWVYRIAINESINFSKKQKRLEEYESGVSGSRKVTPADEFGADDLTERIGQAILALKMDYRLVIVLKHYHDYSYQEMSDVLGIPEKTVKSRLFSARQQLKEILKSEGVRL
jgi:RNA polymerase sigma-70 factor (ECF subfamily)